MRIPVLLACMAVIPLAAAPSAAAAESKPTRCAAAKSKTLAASTEGRVYERDERAYSCSYRTGKRTQLGNSFECAGRGAATQFRFAGRLLGFVHHRCHSDIGNQRIRVIDMRTGRIKWTATAIVSDFATDTDSSTRIANWEMRGNGSLVWIGERYAFPDDERLPNLYEVWKLVAAKPRSPQKLDEGGAIDPKSLALGSRGPVYWRKGGTIFSATLR